MSADVISSFLGMTLQATGNNNNAWGTILNGSALQIIERRISGNIVRAVTGGTLNLSASPPPAALAQVLDFVQIFQGTLTANQIVIVPNLSAYWKFVNETTGAFQILLQVPSGNFVNIPQGCSRGVTCDGAGNLIRDDKDQVGNFEYNAVSNAGTLAANGASVLRADFPDLFAKYSTTFGSADSLHFTLPLLTDTGRYLRSTTSTLTVGTYQANQNLSHTHTLSGAPGVGTLGTDSQGSHTHTATPTDPGHTHSFNNNPVVTGQTSTTVGSGGVQTPAAAQATTIAANTTGISVTIAVNGAHTHNITGAPTLGTMAAATSGGSEARPESLAVIISIRY